MVWAKIVLGERNKRRGECITDNTGAKIVWREEGGWREEGRRRVERGGRREKGRETKNESGGRRTKDAEERAE